MFLSRLSEAPIVTDAAEKALAAYCDDLREEAAREGDAARAARALLDLLQTESLARLISGTLEASPYLRQAIRRSPERFAAHRHHGSDAHVESLRAAVTRDLASAPTLAAAMPIVRRFKAEAALLAALADLGGSGL